MYFACTLDPSIQVSFFINGYYFYLYFQGSRQARRQQRVRVTSPPRSTPSQASPRKTVQGQQTLTLHPPGPALLPPAKTVKKKGTKLTSYQFTREQEVGIAAWLQRSDWLWNQGVSILFRILFICIYLFIYMFIICILL